MNTQSIGFIGGGRVTGFMLQAFADAGITGAAVYDPDASRLDALRGRFSDITVSAESVEVAARAAVVFIAVHPPVMMETLQKIRPFVTKDAVVVSLAPKISIAKMREVLSDVSAIARVNPSAPGVVGKGLNPVAFAVSFPDAKRNVLISLLGTLGEVPVVAEEKIEAYAIISAMGPTYFWFQLQKLRELAVRFGMDDEEAKRVIAAMIQGAVATLFDSGMQPGAVMDLVPVRPLADRETELAAAYDDQLTAIFEKIRP